MNKRTFLNNLIDKGNRIIDIKEIEYKNKNVMQELLEEFEETGNHIPRID